jgi:hypothetical protein
MPASPPCGTAPTNTIARAADGETFPQNSFEMTNIFSLDHAAKIVKTGLSKLWGWFGSIGDFFSSAIGIFFVFKIIWYGAKLFFNGLSIQRATGCGFALLASVCTSATHWIIGRQPRPTPSPESSAPGENVKFLDLEKGESLGQRRVTDCPVQ